MYHGGKPLDPTTLPQNSLLSHLTFGGVVWTIFLVKGPGPERRPCEMGGFPFGGAHTRGLGAVGSQRTEESRCLLLAGRHVGMGSLRTQKQRRKGQQRNHFRCLHLSGEIDV